MDFTDIPQFPRAHYEVDVGWDYLEAHLKECVSQGLDINPDYQRAHVWKPTQRTAYVEYVLRGGEVAKQLIINAPKWESLGSYEGATLVDGKQRLDAVRAFLRGELLAFGLLRSQFTGRMRHHLARFHWRVMMLRTRAEVYDLYLAINSGGTPHTTEELDRVRRLRAGENG